MIRAARAGDLPALRELERAAGAAFRDIGMAAVADDAPPALAVLRDFQKDGRAWVVADDHDQPVAYILVEIVAGDAHIDQVSVHPGRARQGLGRALIDTAGAWARERGMPALTLTTYRDVPWNAPYYARLGFQTLTEDQLSDPVRRIRDDEAARGLAAWPRVVMRRPMREAFGVTGPPGSGGPVSELIEVWQAEWCPHSREVREALTELAIPFVARQVPAEPEDRDEMHEAVGSREIPVVTLPDGTLLDGEADDIVAALRDRYPEPAGAAAHRSKAAEKAAGDG